MGRIGFWNPKIADKEIMPNAMKRLKKSAEVVATKARAKCPVGTTSRPMYRTGRYAGQYWTARDAGALKKTIRVVEKRESNARNIRVYAGTKKVFYAQIVEYYQPFLRKALNASKSQIKGILANG
jgi:hypothetical protein